MNAYSKKRRVNFILACSLLACFALPAHAVMSDGEPLSSDLADCDLKHVDHGATERDAHGMQYFFVNVAFTCASMDELATTLAVENFAKNIVRRDVKGKGWCSITSASLDGSLLTRGLPGAEPIAPDQTNIRYMAEAECERMSRGKGYYTGRDKAAPAHKPKVHKKIVKKDKPAVVKTSAPTPPPPVRVDIKPPESTSPKKEEPAPEEKPATSPLPGTKPFWKIW